MTVPPPPAVPGELIEKAAKALRQADEVIQTATGMATAVLAAVYGDIVEAARRDALREAAEAIAKEREDDRGYRVAAGFDEDPCDVPHGECHAAAAYFAFDTAARIVADLANAPAASPNATHADGDAENAPAPVRSDGIEP